MLIVHLTSTDPAGAVYNWCRAINEHTEHTARLIATEFLPEFDFPRDIHELYDAGEEIEALLEKADVIHFHKVDESHEIRFNVRGKEKVIRASDHIAGGKKKVVYQLHGHHLERGNPAEWAKLRYADKPADRPILAVTPDLEEIYKPLLGERVRYFPNCVPVRDMKYMPRPTDALHNTMVGKELVPQVMVVQTPTHSILKNTHLIKSVVERLGQTLPVFFYQVGPNPLKTQDITLRLQRASHIVFDHMEGYYGLSSLQGLSMGKPTIAGLSEYSRRRMAEFWEIDEAELPWSICRSERELEVVIRTWVVDADQRRSIGQMSRDFMEAVWSDRAVAEKLGEFYDSL